MSIVRKRGERREKKGRREGRIEERERDKRWEGEGERGGGENTKDRK